MLFVIMSKLAALIVFAVRVVAYIIRFFLDLFHGVTFPVWLLLGFVAWPIYNARVNVQYAQMRKKHGKRIADIWRKEMPDGFWAFWRRVRF